jgi:hypothetical protein
MNDISNDADCDLSDDPRALYPAIDEAWSENWDHPLMMDYDRYESVREARNRP